MSREEDVEQLELFVVEDGGLVIAVEGLDERD